MIFDFLIQLCYAILPLLLCYVIFLPLLCLTYHFKLFGQYLSFLTEFYDYYLICCLLMSLQGETVPEPGKDPSVAKVL